jgi:hypothetical protein
MLCEELFRLEARKATDIHSNAERSKQIVMQYKSDVPLTPTASSQLGTQLKHILKRPIDDDFEEELIAK